MAEIAAHAGAVGALAAAADGAAIASGGADGTVKVWDAGTGKAKAAFDGLAGEVTYLQFDATGRQLYAVAGGALARFDLAASKPGATIDAGKVVAVGDGIAALGGNDGKVALVELNGGREVKTLTAHKGAVRFLAFPGSAARLISSGDDGALRLWDTGSGEKLAEVITTATGWAVIDRQGRFDGSEQGMNDVGWHARD